MCLSTLSELAATALAFAAAAADWAEADCCCLKVDLDRFVVGSSATASVDRREPFGSRVGEGRPGSLARPVGRFMMLVGVAAVVVLDDLEPGLAWLGTGGGGIAPRSTGEGES
jgi:hypothetical protein